MVRLLVFHHAGGSGAGYYPLSRALPRGWDLLLVDLPGRGRRHAEPPLSELHAIVDDLVAALTPWADAPLALFGHSLGAVVATEVARGLTRDGLSPTWLGVSGRVPPALQAYSRRRLAELPDEQLVPELTAMGGLPERVLDLAEFRERFLPVVRSDLRAVDSYRPDPGRAALTCPITAFGGESDQWAPPHALQQWRRETTGGFDLRLFPGGHFYFLGAHFPALASVIMASAGDAAELAAA